MPGIQQVSFTSPYAADEMAIQRRQKLAEMLAKEAIDPIQTNRMAGRFVVPVSPWEGAAKIAKGLGSAYLGNQAEEKQKALGEKASSERSAALAKALGMMSGSPADPGVDDPTAGYSPPTPAQPPNPQGALQSLAQSNDPMLQQAGTGALIQQMVPQKPVVVGRSLVQPMPGGTSRVVGVDSTWQAEQQAAREQRAQELQDKLADQGLRGQERNDLMRELADMRLQGQKELRAMVQAGQVTKPPAGYRPTKEGNLEAIPGGPADTKLQGALNQDTAMLQSSTSNMDRLASAANEALNHPGLAGTMGLRGVIPNIPGTAAADAAAKLSTLKSQVAFGVLQDMRNNSKTGGALGAVSDKEGALLQANLAALEKSQSVDQMKESLQKIIKYTDDAKTRLQNAYNMKHKEGVSTPQRRSTDTGNSGGLTPQEQQELQQLRQKFGR